MAVRPAAALCGSILLTLVSIAMLLITVILVFLPGRWFQSLVSTRCVVERIEQSGTKGCDCNSNTIICNTKYPCIHVTVRYFVTQDNDYKNSLLVKDKTLLLPEKVIANKKFSSGGIYGSLASSALFVSFAVISIVLQLS